MTDFVQFPKVIFHATLLKYLDPIRERILIHRKDALYNLDFGKGFYTTTSYQQAIERALLLQERERDTKSGALKRDHRGIIISFELDAKLLYSIGKDERKVFVSNNQEWADYIVFNRMHRNEDTPHEFKWVYGLLADGKSIGLLCKQYCNGEISPEQLINGYEKAGTSLKGISPYSDEYDQLSFHEDEDLVNSVLKYQKFNIIDQHKISQKRW